MKKLANVAMFALLIPVALLAFGAGAAFAQTSVTVDPAVINLGYMNVYNLGGGFEFGSGWGLPDLTAIYTDDIVTLGPNTIGDPDPYWYLPSGGPGAEGNKIMEANVYGESNGPLAGQTITFSGTVIDNSLTDAHVVKAFVKDYAPDFSTFVESSITLSATGAFTVSLNAINDPARHIQWGFQMIGVNVWITDVAPFGTMSIGPDGAVATENSTLDGVKALYR